MVASTQVVKMSVTTYDKVLYMTILSWKITPGFKPFIDCGEARIVQASA